MQLSKFEEKLIGIIIGIPVFSFFILINLVGCVEEKFEESKFKIIQIGKCEYIEFRPDSIRPTFLHKADCPNHKEIIP